MVENYIYFYRFSCKIVSEHCDPRETETRASSANTSHARRRWRFLRYFISAASLSPFSTSSNFSDSAKVRIDTNRSATKTTTSRESRKTRSTRSHGRTCGDAVVNIITIHRRKCHIKVYKQIVVFVNTNCTIYERILHW